MEHIAIMKKSWGLTNKIISGQKTIESRWYKYKHTPWNKIKAEEIVYFKDLGSPVSIKTTVNKVLQFSNLTSKKIRDLLDTYYLDIGIESEKLSSFFEQIKEKKYAIFIFLKNPEQIYPFEIDKSGFGSMSAWISVEDIKQIKK
ncbi:hypothetical protein HYU21_03160 [Candidatus Woesearchaeota archaeon]|nr:hypothetical protein [Candidatus Woesearchaeota archaeon]